MPLIVLAALCLLSGAQLAAMKAGQADIAAASNTPICAQVSLAECPHECSETKLAACEDAAGDPVPDSLHGSVAMLAASVVHPASFGVSIRHLVRAYLSQKFPPVYLATQRFRH